MPERVRTKHKSMTLIFPELRSRNFEHIKDLCNIPHSCMDDMQHSIQQATAIINTIRWLIYMFNTCALEQLRLFTDVHTDIGLVVVIMAWPRWQNEEAACFHPPFPQQVALEIALDCCLSSHQQGHEKWTSGNLAIKTLMVLLCRSALQQKLSM